MKALILKELRENSKVGVLGLVVFSLMLVQVGHATSELMTTLGWEHSYMWNAYDKLQPLTSSNCLLEIGWFCGVFGAVLGFLQIFNERHRDLWAFLVHRPATRTSILASKVIAGLGLYLLAAGLPLLCFIAWVSIPGHVAAPYEWAMALPCLVWLLLGIVFYFAGMLTGLRQARWYGSRALGLGLAILVALVMASDFPLWAVLLAVLLGGGVLATAVWGAFNSHGHYQGQPMPAKLALIATVTPGVIVAAIAATALFAALFSTSSYTYYQYSMTRDGKVFKVTYSSHSRPQVEDLEGKPFIDQKTGRMIEMEAFQRLTAPGVTMMVDFGDQPQRSGWAHESSEFFKVWRSTPDTLWYFWNRYGRLAGFDLKTRRFIGSLGPQGFTRDQAAGPDRFDAPLDFAPWAESRILKTPTTVCRVYPEEREVKVIFTATNGETIGGAKDTGQGGREEVLLATRQFVSLVALDGTTIWKTPYTPAYPDYANIEASFLQPAGQYALRIAPSWKANLQAQEKLPTHLTWLAEGQGEVKSTVLPPLPRLRGFDFQEKLISLAAPPAFLLLVRSSVERNDAAFVPLAYALFSLGIAVLVCLPATWGLGRRYCLSVPARCGWGIFVLLLGVPGFLAFLCLQEWPAREACPNCKKPCVVTQPQCEHCAAAFAAPEKTGTEIFEALAG